MAILSWSHFARTYAKPLRTFALLFLLLSLLYFMRTWSARGSPRRLREEDTEYEGSADYATASGNGEEESHLDYDPSSYSTFEEDESVYDNKVVPIVSNNVSRCDDCFPKYKQKLVPLNLCDDDDQAASSIDALILIMSHPSSVLRRQALRESWLLEQSQTLRHVFVLEDPEDESLQTLLGKEQQRNNDILQFSGQASYDVIPTVKTILALRWASQECSRARTVLKTKDDVYINSKKLLELVRTMEGGPMMLGECSPKPKEDKDIGYCAHPVYLMSRSAVSAILSASPNIPPVQRDAFYIAMCLHVAGVTTLRDVPSWSWVIKPEMTQGIVCSTLYQSLAILRTSPKTARELWDTCKDYTRN